MKAICMAGGQGTRLTSLTTVCPKSLLPVYDRPMICYPLYTLRECGITSSNTAIVTVPEHQATFKKLLGNSYTYIAQPAPKGIAEAPLLAESWLKGDDFVVILGDNLFIDFKFPFRSDPRAAIFLYKVAHPEQYGCFDGQRYVEKPTVPGDWKAIPGLYYFPGDAPEMARTLLPGERGELEILDLVRHYANDNRVQQRPLDCTWFDLGTPEELLKGAEMVWLLRQRGNSTFGCL